MDQRVALIKSFYRGLPTDRVKLETSACGFEFLAHLRERGIQLEYGELTTTEVLHKYKLTNVSDEALEQLLAWHVAKLGNVCLYFDRDASPLLSFNLDNDSASNNTELIPEVELAMRTLAATLQALGCKPLVIASGRGYHVWCRLQAPVPNPRLYQFMIHLGASALLAVHEQGLNQHKVKVNLYPDVRIQGLVSLRLFGSAHAKTHVFSRILDLDHGRLLDEAGSWARFESHLARETVAGDTFDTAYRQVVTAVQPVAPEVIRATDHARGEAGAGEQACHRP